MAILRVFQTIENDLWKLRFVNDPDALSDTDKKKMKQFGEPTINLGGDFTVDAVEFTLPNQYVKIRTDFPVTQSFDSTIEPFDTDTADLLVGYRTEIVDRFTDALTTLRAIPDTFTGEHTYTI